MEEDGGLAVPGPGEGGSQENPSPVPGPADPTSDSAGMGGKGITRGKEGTEDLEWDGSQDFPALLEEDAGTEGEEEGRHAGAERTHARKEGTCKEEEVKWGGDVSGDDGDRESWTGWELDKYNRKERDERGMGRKEMECEEEDKDREKKGAGKRTRQQVSEGREILPPVERRRRLALVHRRSAREGTGEGEEVGEGEEIREGIGEGEEVGREAFPPLGGPGPDMVSDGRSVDRAITISDEEDSLEEEVREWRRRKEAKGRRSRKEGSEGGDEMENDGEGVWRTGREGGGGAEPVSSASSGPDLPEELLRASVAELRAICDDGLDSVEEARQKSTNLKGGQSRAIKIGGSRTRAAIRALCRRARAQEGEAVAMAERRNKALVADRRKVERENEKLRAEIGEIRRDMADLRQELNDRDRLDIRKAVEEEIRKERSRDKETRREKEESDRKELDQKEWKERERKLMEEFKRNIELERENSRREMERREKEWKEKERRDRERWNREMEVRRMPPPPPPPSLPAKRAADAGGAVAGEVPRPPQTTGIEELRCYVADLQRCLAVMVAEREGGTKVGKVGSGSAGSGSGTVGSGSGESRKKGWAKDVEKKRKSEGLSGSEKTSLEKYSKPAVPKIVSEVRIAEGERFRFPPPPPGQKTRVLLRPSGSVKREGGGEVNPPPMPVRPLEQSG